MNGITIFQVIYGLKYGGAEKLLIPLSCGMRDAGFRVVVVALTCAGPVEDDLKKEGIEVIVLRRDARFGLPDFIKLVSLIRKEKPQIIHTHLQNADIIAGLAARLCRVPQVSTFHGRYHNPGWLEEIKQRIRVFLPHRIIAVSQDTARYCSQVLKVGPGKVSVIYNGIDIDRFYTGRAGVLKKEDLGVAADERIIFAFGRLEHEKGHKYLIEALPAVKDKCPEFKLKLLIAGEGSLKQRLSEIIACNKLTGDVLLLGGRRDIPELLEIADIVVNPSLSEGLPLTCLEAMAAGKAIIATGVGGVNELLSDGIDAVIIKPADQQAIASAISDLLRDDGLAEKISRNAREKAGKYYSADKMIEKLLYIYDVLTGER